MKQSNIKDLTDQELRDKVSEEQDGLAKARMNHAVSPLENPYELRNRRKVIARLKTELRSRELSNK